jgi:hypothetical protein
VLGPDGGQRSETTGSLDVTDNTDDDHRRGLDDGNGLDDFSLVHLGSGSVEVSDDVGHTGLVTHAGSEVDGLLGVILVKLVFFLGCPVSRAVLLSSVPSTDARPHESASIRIFPHPSPPHSSFIVNKTYLGESLNSTPVSGGTLPGNCTVSTTSISRSSNQTYGKQAIQIAVPRTFGGTLWYTREKLEGQESFNL